MGKNKFRNHTYEPNDTPKVNEPPEPTYDPAPLQKETALNYSDAVRVCLDRWGFNVEGLTEEQISKGIDALKKHLKLDGVSFNECERIFNKAINI